MNIEHGADTVARWLEKIRAEGRPCPTNLVQSAKIVLDCSPMIAKEVKRFLTESGRLIINPVRRIFVIDGKHFDTKIEDTDEVSIVKRLLQRHYKPVYDPRTVARPLAVAAGEPEVLIVGAEVVPYALAKMKALSMRPAATS